jgi:DNA (cytosine-5)-methyltransferase 1
VSKPTVLSLFSGIGGFDLGLERAGFDVVGQCEIDPFCNRVLAAHWPEVPRYDDVRRIGSGGNAALDLRQDGGQRPISSLQPTLICGGFPCQDLSVAGKRAGLAGVRSGLWFEFHRILSELRPAYALIENVPGLLSSNDGRDFAVVLDGLGELWPAVGWAVLDSQHFGVPQRRRRVYVVAGPRRESVQQILSLCEGGDWHPAKGREAREDVAYTLSAGVRGTGDGHGNAWNSNYVANPLTGHHPRQDLDNDTYIPVTVGALTDGAHHGGGLNGQDAYSGRIIAHSLRAEGFDASEDGTGRGTPIVSVRTAQTSSNGWGVNEEGTAYTLDGANGQAIAGAAVRRLTPTECERLQGFPDSWTKLDDSTPDGPRYKALGNAVSVPVIEYIGLRLMDALRSADVTSPATRREFLSSQHGTTKGAPSRKSS